MGKKDIVRRSMWNVSIEHSQLGIDVSNVADPEPDVLLGSTSWFGKLRFESGLAVRSCAYPDPK